MTTNQHEGSHDVVLVGSGAAGLPAAVSAARHGANVVILEATDLVGGTTATSGGMVWAPVNGHLPDGHDNRDDAFSYAHRLAGGLGPGTALLGGYLTTVNEALALVGWLLEAALAAGVEILTETRAVALIQSGAQLLPLSSPGNLGDLRRPRPRTVGT